MEEVQKFKHLGFTFNKKEDYKVHIKELSKKGKLTANKIWGLEERICQDDFNRR